MILRMLFNYMVTKILLIYKSMLLNFLILLLFTIKYKSGIISVEEGEKYGKRFNKRKTKYSLVEIYIAIAGQYNISTAL